MGNQEVGCSNRPGICPDGTICDENAECIKPPGLKHYICKCKVGWAGSGKVCGPDIDLDAWPDQDLPCNEVSDFEDLGEARTIKTVVVLTSVKSETGKSPEGRASKLASLPMRREAPNGVTELFSLETTTVPYAV